MYTVLRKECLELSLIYSIFAKSRILHFFNVVNAGFCFFLEKGFFMENYD